MKKIADIMSESLEIVTPATTLQAAAQKMADHDIGFLIVCEGSRLVGCLTDRDLAVQVVARGFDARDKRVHDIMTRNVLTLNPHDKVQKAYQMFNDHYVRRLVVVDERHQPVGVVTMGDLAAHADEDEFNKIGKLFHHLTEDLAS